MIGLYHKHIYQYLEEVSKAARAAKPGFGGYKTAYNELRQILVDLIPVLYQASQDRGELWNAESLQMRLLPLAPLDPEEKYRDGAKLTTGTMESDFSRLAGYFKAANPMGGDYFDCRRLDSDHMAVIKCRVAGQGVMTWTTMSMVVAILVDYFRMVRDAAGRTGLLKYNLRNLVFRINDLLNEIGFSGYYAAFQIYIINEKTGEYEVIHAGDNLVVTLDARAKEMKFSRLPGTPTAGAVDSWMIRSKPEVYRSVKRTLNHGDFLIFFTDDLEDSYRNLRDRDFKIVNYGDLPREVIAADMELVKPVFEYGHGFPDSTLRGQIYEPLDMDGVIEAYLNPNKFQVVQSEFQGIYPPGCVEPFGLNRIRDVVESVMNRREYMLQRRCDLTIDKPLRFDFSGLEGSPEDIVSALNAVERVFRLVPDPAAGPDDGIVMERKLADFMKKHFTLYDEFFSRSRSDENSSNVFFSHIKEDPQSDDISIWVYQYR